MRRRQIQYTIRDVPPEVDRALKARARRAGKSLNRELLGLLCRESGVVKETLHHDLDAVFGSWVADPEFDRAIAEQHRIDPKLWK